MSDVESAGAVDDGGCPVGEQPIFGPAGDLVCSQIPAWPPESAGSRATPGQCVLPDGVYSVRWHSDVVERIWPAFSVTRTLTIAGDSMTLDDYAYKLDWTDSASANVWQPGNTDTWEFRINLDCQRGVIVGSYTVTLPYYNPGHQVETWRLDAKPIARCSAMQCSFTICGICQACGETEVTCNCYRPDGTLPCAPEPLEAVADDLDAVE